jgi:hypothetical protein
LQHNFKKFEKESLIVAHHQFTVKFFCNVNIVCSAFKMAIEKDPRQQIATSSRPIPQVFPFPTLEEERHENVDSSSQDEDEEQISQLHRILSMLDAALEIVSGEPSLSG